MALWGRGSTLVEIADAGGVSSFSVRVSPGASRTRVLGEYAGALKIAVSAPPEKGKANDAVLDLLSAALNVRKSDLSVVAGQTSRDKRIAVTGLAPAALSAKLSALITQMVPLSRRGKG